MPLSNYDRVIIEPATIWADLRSEPNSVQADQKRALANGADAEIYSSRGARIDSSRYRAIDH